MNHYAYRVYRNQINNPIYVGTVSAQDMDSAVNKVISSCKIGVVHEIDSRSGIENHYFTLNDSKVGILIYANPENH